MSSPAWGNWSLIANGSVSEEFTDNLYLSSTSRKSSFITTISPEVLIREGTERSSAGTSARLNFIEYSHDTTLRSLEQEYNGFLRYSLTPLISSNITAHYGYYTRPDRDIKLSGLVITQNSKQQNYKYALDWKLNEKLDASFSYGYGDIRYTDDNSLNMASHMAHGGFLFDLEQYLPRAKLDTLFDYSHTEYATSTVANYSASINAHYALHELWTLNVGFGGRYTRSRFDKTGGQLLEQSTGGAGWISNASLTYKGELSTINLNFNRNIIASTGRSGSVESTSAAITFFERFTQAWSTSLAAGYYDNFSKANELSLNEINEMTVRVSPSVHYAITSDLNMGLSYEYTYVRNRHLETQVRQNKVLLQLNLQVPLLQ